MKTLSKFFAVLFSIALLSACNFMGDTPEAEEAMEDGTVVESTMPVPGMEVDEMEVNPESVDEEVDALMEEEAAIDEELSTLEADGL